MQTLGTNPICAHQATMASRAADALHQGASNFPFLWSAGPGGQQDTVRRGTELVFFHISSACLFAYPLTSTRTFVLSDDRPVYTISQLLGGGTSASSSSDSKPKGGSKVPLHSISMPVPMSDVVGAGLERGVSSTVGLVRSATTTSLAAAPGISDAVGALRKWDRDEQGFV